MVLDSIRSSVDGLMDRSESTIGGVTGAVRSRAAGIVAGAVGFVGTTAALATNIPDLLMSLPDALLGAVLSVPGIVVGGLGSVATGVAGAVAGWLPGFSLAMLAVLGDQPLIAVLALAAIVVGWANPYETGPRIRLLMRLLLLGVLSYVAAVALGPGVVSSLGLSTGVLI